MIIIYLL